MSETRVNVRAASPLRHREALRFRCLLSCFVPDVS